MAKKNQPVEESAAVAVADTSVLIYVSPEQFGLPEAEAENLAQRFLPVLQDMTTMEPEALEVVDLYAHGEPTQELCERARRLRLRYVKTRTATAAAHKEAKAYYLAGGRYVDAWKTAQSRLSEERESMLADVEEHFERIEQQRIEVLTFERNELLKPFEAYYPNAGTFDEETFENLLAGAKARYEQKVAAEKAAEAERIESARREAEQREAARLEAARLAEENRLLREAAAADRARMEAQIREEMQAQVKADAQRAAEAARAAQAEVDRLSEELAKNHALLTKQVVDDSPFDEPSPERAAGQLDVIKWLETFGFADAARLARIHFIA